MLSAPYPTGWIAHHSLYNHALLAGHRFPMDKYELIPQQLIYEGIAVEADFFSPAPLEEEIILWTHDANYWCRMKGLGLTDREMRAIGFPLSAELVERERRIARGTIDCALYALRHGVALNVAGGTHHAFSDRGEGFCLLNDFAVTANYLLQEHLVQKILILDLDVHQGNGTASLFREDSRVFTCSFHGRHNYPFHKEQSDLDIGLEDGTTGPEYLRLLQEHIPPLLDEVQPDLVCYLSGVDVLATDKFGKLQLSVDECRERDYMVFAACNARDLPVAVAMGGGYSTQLRHIVTAHVNTFRMAKEVYRY